MTAQTKKIPSTDDAWDETGPLGNDPAHMKKYDGPDEEATIDEALGLQMISIRLQKSLIEDFKVIGALIGVGYQPLMRQALKRFADSEMKRMARNAAKTRPSSKPAEKSEPPVRRPQPAMKKAA